MYTLKINSQYRVQVQVDSIDAASRFCREVIEYNDLGSRDWKDAKVYDGANQIARVSYNGRVWNMDGTPA